MSPNEIIYALQSWPAKIAELNELLKADRAELAAAKAECERLKFALVEWEAKERGWSKAVEKDAAELTRLRAEVERLTACLKTANGNHEQFERQFYLEQARAEKAEDVIRALCRISGIPIGEADAMKGTP
jgi:predicted  nucleic acid-binding Zn-ribbon protein